MQDPYLGFTTPENVHHDLHDCLMHAQCPHQVRVLVENFVVHDVSVDKWNGLVGSKSRESP